MSQFRHFNLCRSSVVSLSKRLRIKQARFAPTVLLKNFDHPTIALIIGYAIWTTQYMIATHSINKTSRLVMNIKRVFSSDSVAILKFPVRMTRHPEVDAIHPIHKAAKIINRMGAASIHINPVYPLPLQNKLAKYANKDAPVIKVTNETIVSVNKRFFL